MRGAYARGVISTGIGDALLAAPGRDPDPECRWSRLLACGDRHQGPQDPALGVERRATTVEEGPGGAEASRSR